MAQIALAADLTVAGNTSVSTPLETAKASNNSPGNITIELGGHVAIATPGSTLTINSNNFIDHSGTVESLANANAIGVHILGGFAGNFTAQGSAGAIINVIGNGTGNYGLLLDGASAFTGNITFQPASAIIVYGENSVGVAIDAPLDGNLTTGAGLQAAGLGTTGVRITREITGTYVTSGTITVRGTSLYTVENVDPLSGSGIAIGAGQSHGQLDRDRPGLEPLYCACGCDRAFRGRSKRRQHPSQRLRRRYRASQFQRHEPRQHHRERGQYGGLDHRRAAR
jgi:hypothetical protein